MLAFLEEEPKAHYIRRNRSHPLTSEENSVGSPFTESPTLQGNPFIPTWPTDWVRSLMCTEAFPRTAQINRGVSLRTHIPGS